MTCTLNVKDFGAAGDGVTDDTAAINRAFNKMRELVLPDTVAGRPSAALNFPHGQYYCGGSINATRLRGYGWRINFDGAQIFSAATGKVAIDFLHSRHGTINNLVLRSDASNKPLVGVQVGYSVHQVSSGNMAFNSPYIVGNFTRTAYYNGGSEQTACNNGLFRNEETTSNSYAVIDDSANWWKRTSEFTQGFPVGSDLTTASIQGILQSNPAVVTHSGHPYFNGYQIRIDNVVGMTQVNGKYFKVANATANTYELQDIDSTGYNTYISGGDVARVESYSFVLVTYNNCTFFKTGGGSARWKGWSSSSHQDNGCYHAVGSGQKAMELTFDPVNSNGGSRHDDLKIHSGFESSGMSSCIRFNRLTDGDATMVGFDFIDHLPFAENQIFESTPNPGGLKIIGADITIPSFRGNSNTLPTNGLFNDPDKFKNSSGVIRTKRTALTGIPTNFMGAIFYGDRVVNTGITEE